MDWSQRLRHWEKSSFDYSTSKWIIAFYPCTQINPGKSGHIVSCNRCNPRGLLCTGMERTSITSSITTSTGTMASHGPLKIQTQRQVLQRRNTREILARFDINDTVAFSGRLLNCEHIQKDWGPWRVLISCWNWWFWDQCPVVYKVGLAPVPCKSFFVSRYSVSIFLCVHKLLIYLDPCVLFFLFSSSFFCENSNFILTLFDKCDNDRMTVDLRVMIM